LQESISVRQLNAIVFVYLVANFDLFEPRIVASKAGGDALVSVVLATLLALFLPAIWFSLARRFPQADIIQYSLSVLASPLGQAAGAIYLFMLVLGGARPSSKVGLIGATSFGWGPAVTVPVILVLIIIAALLARRSLKTIASICEYAAPVATIVVLIVGLTVLGRANWANYTFPSTNWGPALRGAVALFSRFSLAYILLFLLPRTKDAARTMIYSQGTLLLIGMLMAVGTLSLAVHGASATASSLIPSLQLLRDSILGRSPVAFDLTVAIWMIGLTLKAAIAYWLLSTALAEVADAPTQHFLVPVGVVISLLALLFWSNPGQAYAYVADYSRYINLTGGLGIPLLLLLVAWVRARRPASTVPQHEETNGVGYHPKAQS